MPSSTNYKTILDLKPDGVLLSNGPGDPAFIKNSVLKTIRSLVESNIPIFGICLGHQLLSIAFGAKTDKLKFGHRGLNHPSGNSNVVKMTSQNHGYVVSMSTIPNALLSICSLNCNDLTVSGVVHKVKPCFSVQYHPEASPGPHDSDFLFSHFVKVMLACKHS
jgi:carbamoyl-phosphate synthase small subunit